METTFAAFADGRMPKAPKKVTYVAITDKAVAATGNAIVNFRVTYQ